MQSEQPTHKKLLEVGLSPIPLTKGMKRPKDNNWQEYCDRQPDKTTVAKWEKEGLMDHIGLCLGTKVANDTILIAVDIDDDDLVDDVKLAIGDPSSLSGKFGAKGTTVFCVAPSSMKNKKIKRKENGKAKHAPSVEILCHGSQTVVPPSIHPETGKPYTWYGTPLTEGFSGLQVFDHDTLDEIVAICEGKAQPIKDLNEMTWLGPDKGGNTHDSCVIAVGWMVSRGWADVAIHRRIERAKSDACARNGDVYNWPQSTRCIQEWIDSAKAKGMENSSKKSTPKRRPPQRLMAEWAIERLGGVENLATVQGVLRSYRDGHYARTDIDELKREMYLTDENLKENDAKSAVNILHALCKQPGFGRTEGYERKDDPKLHRICLQNGTINVRTGKLEKWDRDHDLTHQLPINWVDEGECPLFDELLQKAGGGEERWADTLLEFFALTFVPDMSFQKFLVLYGPGGNGKGTLTSILTALHDPDAISSVSVTNLNDERKRTSMAGKLLNVSGEQSRLNLVADTYLKKITGEDPIDIRRLYGETENNVYFWVRFIESLNEMPQTSDNSDGLRRRMIILNFLHKIETPDPNFKAKIMEELPVIFSKRLIPALHRLYKRGRFDPPASSDAAVESYMKSNDPVKLWIEERTKDCDKGTPSSELYEDFTDWAKRNGYNKPFTSVFWGQQMNRLGYEVKVKKIGTMSIRSRNLRFKP